MSQGFPEFHLKRVMSDGSSSAAVVYPIQSPPDSMRCSRRGFLGTGVAAASVLTSLSGCGKKNAATEDADREASAHSERIRRLVFSPDGALLASSGNDKVVKIWSMPDGKWQLSLAGHAKTADSVAFSSDNKKLATLVSEERAARIWSLPDGTLSQTITGMFDHEGAVLAASVAFSADQRFLLAKSYDELKVWTLPNGKVVQQYAETADSKGRSQFSPSGAILAAVDKENVFLRSVPDGQVLRTVPEMQIPPVRYVALAAFSSDSKLFATQAYLLPPRIYTVGDGKSAAAIEGAVEGSNALQLLFSADGSLVTLITETSNTCRAYQWSLPGGQALKTLEFRVHEFPALCVSPNGKWLANGLWGDVQLWSFADKSEKLLKGHKGAISALAISPDNKILASGDILGGVILWDLEKGDRLGDEELIDPKISRPKPPGFHFDHGDPATPATTTKQEEPGAGGMICTCNKVCTCVPVRRRR